MDTLIASVACLLLAVGLVSALAIFWRALTGNLPHKNPTPEGKREMYENLWPLCAGGLSLGIVLLLLVRGCAGR